MEDIQTSIVSLSELALASLIKLNEKNSKIRFWMRQRKNDVRLNKGYWFQGNEHYAFIGLVSRGDKNNKTATIGFVISIPNNTPTLSMEVMIGSEEDEKIINIYKEFINIIGGFNSSNDKKYVKYFDIDSDIILCLEREYERIYNILYELLEKKQSLKEFIIPEDKFYKSIDRINEIRNNNLNKEDKRLVKFDEEMKYRPLNNILYGPPGTGKTYNTINKAIEIIDSSFDITQDRKIVKEKYQQLVKEGQIVFTTFHQSMCYEDFIEGIKPLEPKGEGENITYKVIDGIFKNLALEAAFSLAIENESKEVKEILDFSLTMDNYILYVEELLSKDGIVKIKTKTNKTVEIYEISEHGNLYVRHEGSDIKHTVSKDRLIKLYNGIPDFCDVNTSSSDISSVIGGCNSTVYWAVLNAVLNFDNPIVSEVKQREYSPKEKKDVVQSIDINSYKDKIGKPYVLIIDEINRGNVSQIFGELITLLEEDKRAGRDEALEVVLPYSKEKFSVPKNLYVIGTMNTADRSVEALDSALRRRFSFEEMPPNADLISPQRMYWNLMWKFKGYNWNYPEYENKEKELLDFFGAKDDIWNSRMVEWNKMKKEGKNDYQVDYFEESNFQGYNLKKILNTINIRIEKLLDKDHKIGHSYFLNVSSVSDLKRVFQRNIIPLLQEYFFGDYGKIGLVIGAGFFKNNEEQEKNDIFADFNGYDKSMLNRRVYTFKDIDNMKDNEFKYAIDKLINKPYSENKSIVESEKHIAFEQ